jgi:hypothetical protein
MNVSIDVRMQLVQQSASRDCGFGCVALQIHITLPRTWQRIMLLCRIYVTGSHLIRNYIYSDVLYQLLAVVVLFVAVLLQSAFLYVSKYNCLRVLYLHVMYFT